MATGSCSRSRRVWLAGALSLAGCTAVDVSRLPTASGRGEVFVTQETVLEPYDSVGVLQVTRRGVRVFGFGDPSGTDVATAMDDVIPELRRNGADGLMNARVEMTQYTPLGKVVGLIFFLFPQPAEITITGEMVRLKAPAQSPTSPGGPTL